MLVSLKTYVDGNNVPVDTLAGDALVVGKEIGSTAATLTEAAKDPKWQKYVEDAMKTANDNTTSAAQKVQKFAWLPVDFSESGGDLTPTLKLKRNEVAKKYAAEIDAFYN